MAAACAGYFADNDSCALIIRREGDTGIVRPPFFIQSVFGIPDMISNPIEHQL